TNPGFSATQGGHRIKNNVITGNIVGIYLNNISNAALVSRNYIHDNNAAGPASGTGIYSDADLHHVTVDNNTISEPTGNAIGFEGSGAGWASDITVSSNIATATAGSVIYMNEIHGGVVVHHNTVTTGRSRAIVIDDNGSGNSGVD